MPKKLKVGKKREACSAAKKDKRWEKPKLEDVSEKIMAQPYIRFT